MSPNWSEVFRHTFVPLHEPHTFVKYNVVITTHFHDYPVVVFPGIGET